MPTLYIVRHAPKAWKNGRKPAETPGQQHDPPLAEPQVASGLLATTIDQLRGVQFNAIYSSPFLRTRQTAQLILQGLKLSNATVQLVADLGEFLGNQRARQVPDLEATTASAYPSEQKRRALLSEGIRSVEFRVRRFLRALPPQGNFLLITHGLIAEKLSGHELEEGALYVHQIDC
jgi:broad specificity phosphatase PhoE